MITISVCMIVRDEAAVLRRCLSCVRLFADEIIVVDTGSKDETPSIAKEMGAQVFWFPWRDDFAAARNFSFAQATGDYLFWLDADDVIGEADQKRLLEWKKTLDPTVSVVMMRYEMAAAAHEAPLTFERERLLRRQDAFCWKGRVHESIEPRGKIVHSDITLYHRKEVVNDPKRNLRIFETMLKEKEAFQPRDMYYYARELQRHGRLTEAIAWYERFLQENGWVEDRIQACYERGCCYLRLRQQTKALQAFFQSFCYGRPTARICNAIGQQFLNEKEYETAVYWFEQAMACPRRGGFEQEDEYRFVPALQLSVALYYLSDRQRAKRCFEQAAAIHPDHPLIKQNRRFFPSLTAGEESG